MTEIKSMEGFNKEIKTFKDLEKKIIETDKCCACGACISHCESQSFDVIRMEGYTPKFKSDKNADNCTECGVCYYICPQTSELEKELNEFHNIEDEIGHIIKILAAKTTDKMIQKVGQDGGVVSTLLAYLFQERKINAAIVSEYDENFKPIPKIIFNKEELLKSAGTRYSISSQVLSLKDLYNFPQEIITNNDILDIERLKVAFVGTPCQTKAIGKMRFLHIKPTHVIKYVISLFCFENFNYSQLYEILKKETKINPMDIKKTWIKKNFFLSSKDNKEFEVDIKTLNSAIRNHCHECNDFTGKFSDISIGASGAPKGYSMIIIRTENGENLINSALSNGIIKKYIVPAHESSEWKNKKLNWFKKLIAYKAKK